MRGIELASSTCTTHTTTTTLDYTPRRTSAETPHVARITYVRHTCYSRTHTRTRARDSETQDTRHAARDTKLRVVCHADECARLRPESSTFASL